MPNLRQRTWGVFIRPYIQFGGDNIVQTGTLYARSPCQGAGSCTDYLTVHNGSAWMLYEDATYASMILAKEAFKEAMDTLGLSVKHVAIFEMLPTDTIAVPVT